MTAIERTSRVGRTPINIPSSVKINLVDRLLTIEGPKGKEQINVHPFVSVLEEENQIKVTPIDSKKLRIRSSQKKLYAAIPGTVRANIQNAIIGVTELFEKKLKLVGVGYRAQAKGKVLSLSLGFSHPTEFSVPEGVTVETPAQTEIIVKGTSKEQVGQVAADIRSYRGPEPYKGKGVRYADEEVVRKEAKKK